MLCFLGCIERNIKTEPIDYSDNEFKQDDEGRDNFAQVDLSSSTSVPQGKKSSLTEDYFCKYLLITNRFLTSENLKCLIGL